MPVPSWKLTDHSALVRRAALLAALLAVLAGTVLAGPASAHTALRKSTPAKNARIAAPSQLSLAFTEELDPSLVRVQLRGAAGGQHESGPPKTAGDTVTQRVAGDLPAGKYVIVYRVVSADGHPVQGEIPFTVTGTEAEPVQGISPDPATPQPTPAAARVEESGSGGSTGWLPVGMGVIAFGALLGGVYLMRTRRSRR